MDNYERLKQIEVRQVELLSVMASSDAHASKCAKLGLVFADEYAEEYNQYIAARSEYNEKEQEALALKAEIAAYEQEMLERNESHLQES